MKYASLLLALFLSGCFEFQTSQTSAVVRKENPHFSVVVRKQHPFLTDHNKYLIVKYKNKVSSIALYSHPGGVISTCYLFALSEKYILIDCNGVWYTFDLEGSLISKKWNWDKEPPSPLGRIYYFNELENSYSIEKLNNIKASNLYLYRDPPELD